MPYSVVSCPIRMCRVPTLEDELFYVAAPGWAVTQNTNPDGWARDNILRTFAIDQKSVKKRENQGTEKFKVTQTALQFATP
jgi:hypothetical protein